MSFKTGDRVRLTKNYAEGDTPGTRKGDTGTVMSVFDRGTWRISVKFDDYYSRLLCGDYELELVEPERIIAEVRGDQVAATYAALNAAILTFEAAFPELVEED